MTMRTVLLGAITLTVVAACVWLPLLPLATLPFDVRPIASAHALEILPSAGGSPLPAGIAAGDLLHFEDMRGGSRMVLALGAGNAPVGTSVDLTVDHAGVKHDVQVRYVPAPRDLATRSLLFGFYALTALIAALGLLLLWRGQGRAAHGVALWCFALVLAIFLGAVPAVPPASIYLGLLATFAQNVGTLLGLFLVADGLCAEAISARSKRFLRWLYAAILACYCASVATYTLLVWQGQLYYGGLGAIVGLHFLAFVVPLAIFAVNYRRVTGINQARIRWVLLSYGGLMVLYLIQVGLGSGAVASVNGLVLMAPLAAALAGFTYAVLRHQLVSLQFVMNRALVYGLITSLVVGVFAGLLAFLERATLNTGANQLLTMVVPFLLGMGLNTIKRQVDQQINRVFFRRRHRAEAALAQFARSCAYANDAEELLDLAAMELLRHAAPQGVAVYLSGPVRSDIMRVRQQGESSFPERIGGNDLALLRMRAGDMEVDLQGTHSALSQEGYGYALAVRGELQGCLVLGPRPSESYSTEERRLFALVAQQLAVALHLLRRTDKKKTKRPSVRKAATR